MTPSHPVLVRVHGTRAPHFRRAAAKATLRLMLLDLMRMIDNDDADVWALAYAAERAGVRAQEAFCEDH